MPPLDRAFRFNLQRTFNILETLNFSYLLSFAKPQKRMVHSSIFAAIAFALCRWK
ncbi:hypothetical protein LEP1GSC108_2999 [Leptospira weilii str. UI 13098]|uniref:Uncharacterized protein n=1 Tax=Leptospira weilii str. UI 13098 TaxID=1088542 RepID=M6Q4P6_9LEPT|nr:hypothetical protein LEP1GSC108_2999 [Leptospira weilii str. UI 13098]